ncbi:hypothetical protein N665_0530s0009 [Sinapis alba]|nr:hypothetical protein N665_0530s0009 [Sinapis alba]
MILQRLDQLEYDHHHLVPPTGHGAGGLALFWKKNVTLNIISSEANCIETSIIFEGKCFYSSFVYGNTDRHIRKAQWNQLLARANARDTAWFLTGDFNDLLNANEKLGGPSRPEGSFSDLRTLFSEGDLFDLRHSGDPLSWRGQRGTHFVRCRLDRATANSVWAETFPTARSQYLAFEASDHKPLLSFFEPERKRRRGLFRYDRRLKDNVEVKQIIADSWKSSTGSSISDRITRVRRAIIEWSKEQGVNSRIAIEKKKEELDLALSSQLNDTNLINRITFELSKAYAAEEAYWKQRSRLLWLSLGDRNTGYFHATARKRRRANAFSVIENEAGEMVFKEEDIAKVIVGYFKDLFTAKEGDREDTVNSALRPVISEETNLKLIEIPSAVEIREAIFSIHADKAPGPDGFSASFYQSSWLDIGEEIVQEIREFFISEQFRTMCLSPMKCCILSGRQKLRNGVLWQLKQI